MKVDKEAASTTQLEKFFKIAKDFSNYYNHDIYYVYDVIKNLYRSKEGKYNPYAARKKLIQLIEHPNHRYRANCLASATYMSYQMQKLRIPNNILLYFEHDEDGREDYQGILLYKYNGRYYVCDILYHSIYSCISKDLLLFCPYENYPQVYNAINDGELEANKAFIFDTNITPMSGPLSYVRLSEWPPEEYGLYTKEKLEKRLALLKEQRTKKWMEDHPNKR